jgi:hypothetical protein
MASPWQILQYDENGNPIFPSGGAQYDAASDSENSGRSPASMPLMLTPKGRKNYSASSNLVSAPQAKQQPNPVAMQAGPQAQPQGQSPFPLGMAAMKQDIGWTPGMGNQLQDKNQLTEGQKQDFQHVLFQSPERARLNMKQAQGLYAQPVRDESGKIVKDSDGNIVYDPNNTQADPTHPYQQGMAAVNSARELLRQKMMYAPNQTDLSPLMALADAWSPKGDKSNLEAAYHPHTYDQAAQSAMQYMDELQKRQVDLAKEAQSGANNMRAGQQNQALTMQMLQSQMSGMGMGRPVNPYQAQGQFFRQTNTEGQHLVSEGNILNNMIQLIGQGNPSANPTLKTSLARFIEGTVRPQLAVIGQEGGDPSIIQRILNRGESMVNGQLTDEQVGQYKAELQAFLKAHDQNVRAFQARASTMNQHLPQPLDNASLGSLLSPYTHPHGNQGPALDQLPNAKNINPPTPPAGAPAGAPSIMDMIRQTLQENKK